MSEPTDNNINECWENMLKYFTIIKILESMRKFESYEAWLWRTGGVKDG